MPRSFSTTGTTIVDTAADIPTASAAYEGVMVFQKDTNELKICDITNWRSIVDTDTPPSLSLITANSFTASSGVTIDGVFSSAFTNYRLLVNITAASGGGYLNFYLRDGTGNITTNYQWQGVAAAGSAAPTNYNGTGTSGVLGYGGYTNGEWGVCSADILMPFATNWTKTTSIGNGVDSAGAGAILCVSTHHKTAASYTGILLFVPSFTITGTYKIYGYRDSI